MQTVAVDDELAAILASETGSVETGTREALAQRADDLGIPYFLMSPADWTAGRTTIEAWRPS